MELKIDKAGRIVIPKPLRERLGFQPHTDLEALEQPGGVLLKKIEQAPSMLRIDGLWVHQGVPERRPNWDGVIDSVREERAESLVKA